MTRDCMRCGFTFPLEQFPVQAWGHGHHWLCEQCWATNPLIIRVAAIAADGLVRLRAIDALLYLGYVRAARLIACGLTHWPTILELREGALMPRQPLWWISLDADTIALLRMLLRVPDADRTPVPMWAA